MACGAICLRARYAMSDTDIAYGLLCLRTCYAVSGTDKAYGATVDLKQYSDLTAVLPLLQNRSWIDLKTRVCMCPAIALRACYAMSGTCVAYGAIALRAIRY
eukprot:3195940-Rhodomonas_salina.2